MPTVNEQWSLADIPAAVKIAPGFSEKFQKIRQAMMLPPPLPAPVSTTTTMAATQVLMSAQNYQSNTSTFRLGKTATLSSSSHNLSKVNSVLKE